MGREGRAARRQIGRLRRHRTESGAATGSLTLWFLAEYALLVAAVAIAVALLFVPLGHQVVSWFGDISRAVGSH